jgi:hemolysin III
MLHGAESVKSSVSHKMRRGLHHDFRERINQLTHGLALLLSLIGSVVMMASMRHPENWRVITGCTIYALSVTTLFAMSTLSHSPFNIRRRSIFRSLDQGFIYILIAATYTPLSLVYLTSFGWNFLLGCMWLAAVVGFVLKAFFAHRVERVSVWVYVVLGWLPILPSRMLIGLIPDTALLWMLYGGICYTVGVVFLLLDRRAFFFHGIWHLWVMAGSAWHFATIFYFVARWE